MTARAERPIPTRQECVAALAQASARIQEERWRQILAEGPKAAARGTWAPWMRCTEEDLARRYAGLLEKPRGTGAA